MRDRKLTAKNGGWNHESMVLAVEDVRNKVLSERKAAEQYAVNRSTLHKKVVEARQSENGEFKSKAYTKSSMKVFSESEEMLLKEYCIKASKMGYGLSPKKLRSLAFEFAMKLGKRLPHSRKGCPNPWLEKKEAGKDWLKAFLKRNQDLSIRKPEATSIGRMSAFNRHNVDKFYDNIKALFQRIKFLPHQIWNVDETGVTTVQVPEHVIAAKGERQVSAVTSAERGTLVTMCNAVNAGGTSVPPFYIFPRVHFKDAFLKNGPPGCAGVAQKTGWMTEQTFKDWFNHFLAYSHPSKENPILLVLDNHDSHLTIGFIDTAKENGVHLLTIPPHTSHKLQPLDISVYGPFKRQYNREVDSWLINNPGKTVSILEIAELSGRAWLKASMPRNILSGFSSAGLCPFDCDKWKDEDFFLSQVG